MVHIAKGQLHMADESYRALLAFHGKGKVSSSQLTIEQLQNVFDAMVKLGFNVVQKPMKTTKKRLSPTSASGPKDQRSSIRAIWIEMSKNGFIRDGSETALNSWVSRMTADANGGVGIAEVQWLQDDMASKVLEALKKWYRRLIFDALRKGNHIIHPQASYQQVLEKWHRVQEQQQ
jgi:phage gp16-like protein